MVFKWNAIGRCKRLDLLEAAQTRDRVDVTESRLGVWLGRRDSRLEDDQRRRLVCDLRRKIMESGLCRALAIVHDDHRQRCRHRVSRQ